MNRTYRTVVLALLAVAVAGGCSSSDDEPAAGPTTTAEADTDTGAPTPTTSTRPALVEGVARVELLAPGDDAVPSAPRFEWAAVPDAVTYRLAVLGPDGPIWAWEGVETEIGLGGLDGDRPESFGGPVVVEGSTWSVAALDDEGNVVAVSERRPLDPA